MADTGNIKAGAAVKTADEMAQGAVGTTGAPSAQDSGKGGLASWADKLYDEIGAEDRLAWRDSGWNAADPGAEPTLPPLDERYAMYGGGASAGALSKAAPIGQSLPGDDYATMLLRETMASDKAMRDADDPMTWFTGGSIEETVAAAAIASEAAANGVHPVEQAAHDAGMTTGDYVHALVGERGLDGADATRAYAAAMQGIAGFHGIGAEQYVDHGDELVASACTGTSGTASADWSDEAARLEEAGKAAVGGKDGKGKAENEAEGMPSWLSALPGIAVGSTLAGPVGAVAAGAARHLMLSDDDVFDKAQVDNETAAEVAHEGGYLVGSAFCGGLVGLAATNGIEHVGNMVEAVTGGGSHDDDEPDFA